MDERISDFVVAGPGGPGEAGRLECSIAGCFWEFTLTFDETIDGLRDLAAQHLAKVHP
jgi:hypothetical protein